MYHEHNHSHALSYRHTHTHTHSTVCQVYNLLVVAYKLCITVTRTVQTEKQNIVHHSTAVLLQSKRSESVEGEWVMRREERMSWQNSVMLIARVARVWYYFGHRSSSKVKIWSVDVSHGCQMKWTVGNWCSAWRCLKGRPRQTWLHNYVYLPLNHYIKINIKYVKINGQVPRSRYIYFKWSFSTIY